MFVMKLSSLPLNFSLASSGAFGAKKGWIVSAAEDEQITIISTLKRHVMGLNFTFSNLRAEFSYGITLSHLHIVLACNVRFPCNKPSDGIRLDQNFVTPCQLRHQSNLGGCKKMVFLSLILLKINMATSYLALFEAIPQL